MKEVKNPTKKELAELKHHSRRLSIKEGMFWSGRASFGDHYLAPFAIFMGASNSIVAILSSIWSLNSVSQILGSNFVGKIKRKTILKRAFALEAFAYLMILAIAILYYKNLLIQTLPIFLLISLAVLVFAGGIGYPSWFSLMGDLVDNKYLGRWFSKRTTIISFTTIVLTAIAAFILEGFKRSEKPIIGFIILFTLAFLARSYCVKLIGKHYEPKFKIRKEKKFSLKKFLLESRQSNFKRFVIFRGIFAFTVGITSPLVAIYLLRTLQFDYPTYIAIIMSHTFFSIITLNLWGKISDKFGNYKVIALTTMLIPLTPLLWILSSSKIYLFLVPAIIGGTSWSAFLMASRNFIYDNVNKEKRGKSISYFNLLLGIGAFIGGLVGALLINIIKTTWIKPIILIFIIGSIARLITSIIWIPKLKEVKKKENLRNLEELERTIFKEARPTLLEDMHEITSIPNYLNEK